MPQAEPACSKSTRKSKSKATPQQQQEAREEETGPPYWKDSQGYVYMKDANGHQIKLGSSCQLLHKAFIVV